MSETIQLSKGQRINLTKDHPNVTKFRVELGWGENISSNGSTYDLDASAFILKDDNLLAPASDNFVFYNHLQSACKGVVHSGDNRTGAGDGADEIIRVDFDKLNPAANEVSIVITIDEAHAKKQNFGQIRKAYVEVYADDGSTTPLGRYDLTDQYDSVTALQVCSFQKNAAGEVKFVAVGDGQDAGLAEFLRMYGYTGATN